MLQEIPSIIAEIVPEVTLQHSLLDMKEGKYDSPRVILVGALGSSTEDLSGDGAVSDRKFNGDVGDQYSVIVQGGQHHAYVAEQPYQSVELDKQTRDVACAAVKQQHQPTEVEEKKKGKLITCILKEQDQAIEVTVESNREMQQSEVEEVSSRGIQLREYKQVEIGEERSRDMQFACTAEQQHNVLQVNEDSRSMQQQDDPVKIDVGSSRSSRESPLTDVTEKEDPQMGVEHTGGAITFDLDDNEGNCTMLQRQRDSAIQVVELSDDDKASGDDKCTGHTARNQNLEDPDKSIWYYVDPFGDAQGPFPMSALKRWSDNNYFGPDFKVWKVGQSQEEAILLTDALLDFPRN
ncbi:hypothetical protein NE237_018757 [Protea cynaroides]|uniref:GYF domain-containing protein n=1 Tax=Protea cynaroides TaxID=273540 RepID=A0A9Q0KAE9_9MAGN|nr:hypothetical protein NE237_018757 [Protea cynaroides]